MKFINTSELIEYTSTIIGKTFEEIDSEKILENENPRQQKGVLGHVVETGFYGYPRNNDSKADFAELGIELKVTGYVKNKNGSLRAKERLVLSKIDFNKIVNETFESSHVLGKCEKMLIIWYEYDKQKEAKDFVITDYQLYDMNQDKKIFENDFKIIQSKVLEGKAHELSEGDTSYLGACTKARTSLDRTSQPFSDIPSKPRAFSLKNAYMTGILRDNVKNNNPVKINNNKPKIVKNKSEQEQQYPKKIVKETYLKIPKENDNNLIEIKNQTPKTKQTTLPKNKSEQEQQYPIKTEEIKLNSFKTVEEYVKIKLKPYFGRTQLEILEEVSGKKYNEKIPKNISKQISDKIIGKDSELPQINDLFTKTNFVIKNLPIQKNGKSRERMSFKTISLSDFDDEWEDSYWKNYFEETTIITICYQEINGSKNGYRILKDVKKITFNDEDLDAFEKTYQQIKLAIEKADINLLPTSSNGFKNQMLEIAPKGVKGDNAYVNFFKNDKTKVAFMISKKLLNNKLN